MPTDNDAAAVLHTPTATELVEVTAPLAGETVSQLPPLAAVALAVTDNPLKLLVTATALDAGVNTLSASLNANAGGVTETTGVAGARTVKYTCAVADAVLTAVADTLLTVIVPEYVPGFKPV